MGEERDTVLALMRKFVAYQSTDPLKIMSVTYKDGLKGILYIEAFKQTHVKHAIEGISSLRMGLYKQQVNYWLIYICIALCLCVTYGHYVSTELSLFLSVVVVL